MRRFVPGETASAALAASQSAIADGGSVLLTYLGENVGDAATASATASHYLRVLREAHERELPAEISVKLTQLGWDFDERMARDFVSTLAAEATKSSASVWIDMEGSSYVDATVQLYRALRPRHPNLGLCVQAYLHRTANDVVGLLDLEPALRLVKGAYRESREIAYERKSDIDRNFVALATVMYCRASLGTRVALGTHDVDLIRHCASIASAAGIERSRVEVQMLYGIRESDQARLRAEGYDVRTLISYGEGWYAWYMRRLAEHPTNALLAIRQISGL